jgi:ABC-2 type transport system ATP-binding protein
MTAVALAVADLTRRFGSLTAVDGLSLDVHEGEVFGLLGPNGAGKTTAIRLMCGLLRPDAGSVTIRGVPIGRGVAARARVGVCPQDVVLWGRLTCLEQLQFAGEMYDVPGAEARARGERLLRDLDLAEKRDALASTLSGGMQRRLNLALALVHDPEIVVLDEPEAGLDPQARVLVRDYVRSLARRKTVILTTHNMDEADRVADRVAIIDHGKLLVLDTPEQLKHRAGQGDVVEIVLGDPADEAKALAALAGLGERAKVQAAHGSVTIRALDAMALLSAILPALATAGVRCGDVHVRQNTLEDVFLDLTGRRLRE